MSSRMTSSHDANKRRACITVALGALETASHGGCRLHHLAAACSMARTARVTPSSCASSALNCRLLVRSPPSAFSRCMIFVSHAVESWR